MIMKSGVSTMPVIYTHIVHELRLAMIIFLECTVTSVINHENVCNSDFIKQSDVME